MCFSRIFVVVLVSSVFELCRPCSQVLQVPWRHRCLHGRQLTSLSCPSPGPAPCPLHSLPLPSPSLSYFHKTAPCRRHERRCCQRCWTPSSTPSSEALPPALLPLGLPMPSSALVPYNATTASPHRCHSRPPPRHAARARGWTFPGQCRPSQSLVRVRAALLMLHHHSTAADKLPPAVSGELPASSVLNCEQGPRATI